MMEQVEIAVALAACSLAIAAIAEGDRARRENQQEGVEGHRSGALELPWRSWAGLGVAMRSTGAGVIAWP